jgi:hypothetical protein
MSMYSGYDDKATRHPFEQSWRATGNCVSMDLVLYGVAHTYLGVQEVNRNAQEEDKYEQGEQLVRRVSE